jgi:GH15 family glucan-1,4-alpha-glucosidase
MINKKECDKLYRNSLKILKRVQLRNGGILASSEKGRYPYVYPRDHSICILAFISAKKYKEAKKALKFALEAELESGAFPQRYDLNGKDASYKPIQIDGNGLIIYSLMKYYQSTKDKKFIIDYLPRVEKAIKYILNNIESEKNLVFTPNSIHEFPPLEAGLEIWANCVCCAALRETANVYKEIGREYSPLMEISNEIKKGIIENLWNSRINSFVKNIRLKESSSVVTDVDASLIGVPYFGILDLKDKKISQTIHRIEKELWHKRLGGICRYPKYEGRNNGGWGPWPHFTLMVCDYYTQIKNRKKAEKYLNWVVKIAQNYKLPEHISTKKEFNEYLLDFKEAGLLRKDRMTMIENAMKNKAFKKGIAYITLPLSWAHAQYIISYNLYKETFINKK